MDPETQGKLKEALANLPEVIRNAITSADLEKQLRAVSETHQLHIDQWAKLENEVMLTLLGFQDPVNLAANIQSEVGVSADIAATLAKDISTIVFEPIRQELERQLEHPEAQEKQVSATEATREVILAEESGGPPAPAAVLPATPPAPKPTEKAIRAPISSAYTAREPSTERKSVTGDPYREPPA
jgi:hypothetical protein